MKIIKINKIKDSVYKIKRKIFFFSALVLFLEWAKIKYYPIKIKKIASPSYFKLTFSPSINHEKKTLKSRVKVAPLASNKIFPYEIEKLVNTVAVMPQKKPSIQYF